MSHFSGFKIQNTRRFGHWARLLESWISIHQDYVRRTGDAAYWYTERTNIGVMAAAAWSIGLVALEEYQVMKSLAEPGVKASKKSWQGRCDLWIHGASFDELIEAKQEWLHVRSSDAIGISNRCTDSAVSDAKATLGKDKVYATGVSFILPYIAKSSIAPSELRPELTDLIDQVLDCNRGLVAWCFPHGARQFTGKGDRNYIPGVILLADSANAA